MDTDATPALPPYVVEGLPDDEEAPLPPLTDEELAFLRAAITRDTLSISTGPASRLDEETKAAFLEALGGEAKATSLYRDLKRLQKEFPMVMGRHVHVKRRASKTRNKKKR